MPKPILVSAIIAAGILAAFLGPPVRADDKWIEVRSAHFTVYTPASEKEGRKIADQFEQIRALFHAALPGLRIDTPQPILILAVKNEKAMKEMMPEDWEVKGHAHPAGLYQKGLDKDYIVMQLDTPGANPYHVLYHEYTHALMHLNFTNLPVWFDEGIAEYLGNSIIGDKESQIGTIDPNGSRRICDVQSRRRCIGKVSAVQLGATTDHGALEASACKIDVRQIAAANDRFR